MTDTILGSTLGSKSASEMLVEIAAQERGERPPEISRTGSVDPLELTSSLRFTGGPSITACPFAPPIPELDMEIKARLDALRGERGTTSLGTRRRYLDQWMAGLGLLRFAFGGISPVANMEHTFDKDARKAAISRCLQSRYK